MQAQDPDLPPNVIAQQSLPTSNPASKASKVMSRPNPAAAQAALMMAGLNGLSSAQAQAAMIELLQQQQMMMAQGQQQLRLRAPPPLKRRGRVEA